MTGELPYCLGGATALAVSTGAPLPPEIQPNPGEQQLDGTCRRCGVLVCVLMAAAGQLYMPEADLQETFKTCTAGDELDNTLKEGYN